MQVFEGRYIRVRVLTAAVCAIGFEIEGLLIGDSKGSGEDRQCPCQRNRTFSGGPRLDSNADRRAGC